MIVFRVLLLVMLLAGIACFAAYALSGSVQYRRWGVRLVATTVIVGLGFFAVMIAMRLTDSA